MRPAPFAGCLLALVVSVAASAHAERPAPDLRHSFRAQIMGTVVELTLWTGDRTGAASAAEAVFTELRRLDALLSNWVPTSDVQRINLAAGGKAVAISDETLRILEVALAVSRRSGGVFDITVGVFRGLWKFDDDKNGDIPAPAAVRARRKLVGWRDVVIDSRRKTARLRRKGMAITLGGIAKGYAVDRAVAILKDRGFGDFIMQAGGDLYVGGSKGGQPWRVGIRDPRGGRETPFALTELSDRSFSTSGDYERAVVKAGVRYHHILDPRTGFPAMKSRSVTVLARDAFTADAWSKVFFVLGAAKGLPLAEKLGLEVVYVDADNHIHASKGLRIVDGDPATAIAAGLAGKLLVLRKPTDGI